MNAAVLSIKRVNMTPRKSEKIFPKSYTQELLRIAEADLESGRILAQHGARKENAVYHAQQAIEKALKAVLCWKEIPVPLVHDAGILVAKMPQELTPPGGYDLSDLTPYATVKRYQEGFLELSSAEFEAVFKLAAEVLLWAKAQIK